MSRYTHMGTRKHTDLSKAQKEFNDLVSSKPWKYQVSTHTESKNTKESLAIYAKAMTKETFKDALEVVLKYTMVTTFISCLIMLVQPMPESLYDPIVEEQYVVAVEEYMKAHQHNPDIDITYNPILSGIWDMSDQLLTSVHEPFTTTIIGLPILLFFLCGSLIVMPLKTYREMKRIEITTEKDHEDNSLISYTLHNPSLKNIEKTTVIMKEINVEKACAIIENTCDDISEKDKSTIRKQDNKKTKKKDKHTTSEKVK